MAITQHHHKPTPPPTEPPTFTNPGPCVPQVFVSMAAHPEGARALLKSGACPGLLEVMLVHVLDPRVGAATCMLCVCYVCVCVCVYLGLPFPFLCCAAGGRRGRGRPRVQREGAQHQSTSSGMAPCVASFPLHFACHQQLLQLGIPEPCWRTPLPRCAVICARSSRIHRESSLPPSPRSSSPHGHLEQLDPTLSTTCCSCCCSKS